MSAKNIEEITKQFKQMSTGHWTWTDGIYIGVNIIECMDFERLTQELKIRRCSPRTTEVYTYYTKDFLHFVKKDANNATSQDVRNYIEHLVDKKCSGSTIRLAYNSLLFTYSQILKRDIMSDIKIPKGDKKITIGLTKDEVSKLILAIENPKHRLLIELIYASGLRGNEAVKIKVKDILLEEKLAIIRSGKGRKDRKTILSNKFIQDFSAELNSNQYLFPGRNGHLTTRSIQQIVNKAAKKARIKKKVYPHLLRHAFATHLHNNKVDVYYIQKLLGHKSSKTTRGYIQVSEGFQHIQSPHDQL